MLCFHIHKPIKIHFWFRLDNLEWEKERILRFKKELVHNSKDAKGWSGACKRDKGSEQEVMSVKEEVNLCWDRAPMSPGESVCDDENEAGDISIQEVLKKRWMVAVVERQGWRCWTQGKKPFE